MSKAILHYIIILAIVTASSVLVATATQGVEKFKSVKKEQSVRQLMSLENGFEPIEIDSLEWGAKIYRDNICTYNLFQPTLTGNVSLKYARAGLRPVVGSFFNISQKSKARGIIEQWNYGQDFDAAIGDPVFAAAEGTVINAGNAPLGGGGINVRVQYQVQYNKKTVNCYYDNNHLSSVNVRVGESVNAGQKIANAGNTGNTKGAHLDFAVFQIVNNTYHFADLSNTRFLSSSSDFVYGGQDNKKGYALRNSKKAIINPKLSVVSPLQEAINRGIISKHEGAMMLMLYPIESHGSGEWQAVGSDTGNGRRGLGLTQIMNYPEFEIAKRKAGVNFTQEEFLREPQKQIQIIRGLMLEKQGNLAKDYDAKQALVLARQWLGSGCDLHGTCTETYAEIAASNYEVAYKIILK